MTVDIDLRPTEANIFEVAGADLSLVITCVDSGGSPVDVSGYTFDANVLRAGTSVAAFSESVSGASDNVVSLALTDTQTAAIGTGTGLRWELKVTAGGVVDWWYAGDFQLFNPGSSHSTRPATALTAVVGGTITATLAVGVGGGAWEASDVTIADTGNLYESSHVEGTLAEIGTLLALSDDGGGSSPPSTPNDTTDSDASGGINVTMPAGTDRKMYAFVQVLSASVSPDEVLAGGVAMSLVDSQIAGNVRLYAYELSEADFPTINDNLIDVQAQWTTVPDADVQIHAVVLTNVTGTTNSVDGTQSDLTSAPPVIAEVTQASNTDPLLIPYPDPIDADDLLVLLVVTDDPVSLPAGFTEVFTATSAANCEMLVAYKVAAGSETGNLSVAGDTLGAGAMLRVTGAPNTSPIDVSDWAATDIVPTLTAAADDSLLLMFHGRHGPQIAPALTVPAGTTEVAINGSDWRSFGIASKNVDSGATGAQTFDMTGEFAAAAGGIVVKSAGGGGGTQMDASISTVTNGEVVVGVCASDSTEYPITTFGTMADQLVDAASSSRTTVNKQTGNAGLKPVLWSFSGDGTVSNAAALTLRVAPIVEAPPDPVPDTPSGATTIWNTKIAENATLQDAGLITSGVRIDTGVNVSNYAMQAEPIHAIQLETSGTDVEVRACLTRPDTTTAAVRANANAFLTAPIANYTQTSNLSANNLTFYYDDDSGTHTGTVRKIITGGGKHYRPVATGPIYHNFESPPSNLHSEMGTWDAPGRSGSTGAARLSQAGTFIRASEYDAAVGGDDGAIAHAIGLLVWALPILSNTSGGYRWPAYTADANYNRGPSHNGAYEGSKTYMRMGALLALPARLTSGDVSILGDVGAFPNLCRAIAETLYLYGGYIGDNMAWPSYAVPIAASKFDAFNNSATQAQKFQLRDIIASCECVTSNGPTTIGGAASGAARRT